jgi:iduronate 2-sulfatase
MNPAHRFLVLLALVASAGLFAADSARRPNILFIIADDMRPELGCYGVAGIKTPNIDALASRSVRFNRAVVQYPLCNPERSSLLTGHYPTQTKVMDNRQWWGHLHPEWKTIPRWLREHGYVTARDGKIFHDGIDDTDAWVEGGEKRRYADDAAEGIDGAGRTTRAAATGGQVGERASGSDQIVVLPGDGSDNADYRHASHAIELLKKYGGSEQPFFIACGFSRPHSPPSAPQKFYDLYDVDRIPLPSDFAPHPTVPPGFPELSVVPRNTDLFIGRDATPAQAREMKCAYWASVSWIDSQVGRVLAALDDLGLRENTIVVFWGDHGYHLGEKGRWSKAYSLFDVATRSPLLISAPGISPTNGAVCEHPIELINLYRTFCQLCSVPVPDGIEGASMVPLLRNARLPWDRPAYSVVQYREHLGRAVDNGRWHYAEWDSGKGGAMLFDRLHDPDERTNLANDEAHRAIAAEMRALLKKLPE